MSANPIQRQEAEDTFDMQSDGLFASRFGIFDDDVDNDLMTEVFDVDQVSVDQDSEPPVITFQCSRDGGEKFEINVAPDDELLDTDYDSASLTADEYSDILEMVDLSGFKSCFAIDNRPGKNLAWSRGPGNSGNAMTLFVFSRERVGAERISRAFDSLMASE